MYDLGKEELSWVELRMVYYIHLVKLLKSTKDSKRAAISFMKFTIMHGTNEDKVLSFIEKYRKGNNEND